MRVTVFEYERGLHYVKGRFKQVLPPGQYWLWPFVSSGIIRKVDMRSQYVSIPGQSILTVDGVSIKISLTAVYAIADPALAINQTADYHQGLYLLLQNGLRELVGPMTMDDLLSQRAQLNQQLLATTTSPVTAMGLHLTSVNIKDLMLPGDLKKLYAQVVQARQAGMAQLERARGETAVLRKLANAAQLANKNPALLTLRLLQTLEQSSGNTLNIELSTHTNDAQD